MTLNPEWRIRLENWKTAIEKSIYHKLGEVPVEGFLTRDQLNPTEAARGRFKPMKTGAAWGAKWEYAWFRSEIKLPREAAGRQIVLRWGKAGPFTLNAGGDSRVRVNGREVGGCDWAHPEVLLTPRGKMGQTFKILIESYAGHGPMVCESGPWPEGHSSVPEPPAEQQRVREMSFGIWEEDLYQAWCDLLVLLEVRDAQDPNSLRTAEIDAALKAFSLEADLELPRAEMVESVRRARRCLEKVLDCRNGSTAPWMYCFGHSHIDVAWLWPLAETERKCARTFASQLSLMDRYSEYKFLQSQAHLYWMTRRLYPDLYARIKQAVRKGQWLVEGGMWVEPDTNITGGESLIRQILHGKRFFREEFGVNCELLWLPDVFGYSGALPQILVGCGMRYFSTQKIFWNYNGGDPFPYNTFWWEGIDGSQILSHFHYDYNSPTNPASLVKRWNERVQKDGLDARLFPFGWGDGGGGPTRNHLEFLRRQKDLEGVPRTKIAAPNEFFKREERRPGKLPVYLGELYFQAHRGTYTTQARTKRGNRKCEFALREAELWGAVATVRNRRYRYPARQMEETWRNVLLNQFHDIIPGSSINRVYEEAEALSSQSLTDAWTEADRAMGALVKADAGAITVFNSLAWDRMVLAPLPAGWAGAEHEGDPLVTQDIGGTRYVEVSVPGCGWTTLTEGEAWPTAAQSLQATPTRMESEVLRLEFNRKGELVSMWDKTVGRELAASPMNAFKLFKDVPTNYDAWDIDSTYKLNPVELTAAAQIEVISAGPLAAVLRIRRKINQSEMEQEVWLRRNSRRVEFRTRMDWREKHKLLKVAFPTPLRCDEAIHEIQFGHLRRPTHASRPYDADRFEVSNQKWSAVVEENAGLAVLNDCKYGINVEGGSLQLTLLRSPLAPDMTADQGRQDFTYAVYAWTGPFAESGIVREGYDLNVPARVRQGAAGSAAVVAIGSPSVILETVKPAEDGSGDLILRMYESLRTTVKCTVLTELPFVKALSVNLVEEEPKPLASKKGVLELEFKPFEIKTVRLVMGEGNAGGRQSVL
jgi:alpha-mannosidase